MPGYTPSSLKIALLILIGGIALGAGSIQGNGRQALVWRVLNDQNELAARHENAYVEVNGNFYLMGGRGSRQVELYDPTDSTWSNRSAPPGGMQIHHFQPVVLGDTVYIMSAYTGTFPDEPTVDNIYKYAVQSDQWIEGSEIPIARRRGSAGVAVYNGKFYIVGGSTGGHGASSVRKNLFDEYDPVTDSWTTLPNAPFVRDHVHAAVVGDKLYVAGGRNGGNGDTVEEVDVYNFLTGQWSTLPSPSGDLPTPRAGAATLTVGYHVVVIGGESTQELAHNEVEALNTLNNTWVTMNPLNVGRHGTQAIFYNDNIYIAAGAGNKGGEPELDSHEILETMGQTNLPVELAPDFTAIVEHNAVFLDWQTLSEQNNAGFEVQQKIDGAFVAVGFLEGAGTSVSPKRYRFRVNQLPPGRHVFRLKQIDFDGSFNFSPEVSAFITIENGYYLGHVYPNPLNPQARFTLTLAREQHVRIKVYDMLGRQVDVIFEGVLLPGQPHIFQVESRDWAGGKYILSAEGEYFTASKGFSVIK